MSTRAALRCIGIGEILWDLLPSGRQLGGAPANFAYHAHALGLAATVITRVGNDELGREILLRVQDMGLSTGAVQTDESAPTGTVQVELSAARVPQFTIHEQVAWDRITATEAALAAVQQAQALCFGSLAQRSELSRRSIQQLVAASPAGALRVFDINLRQSFYSRQILEQSLHLANALKLSDSELPVLADLFGLGGTTAQQLKLLAERFELRLVALTRGAGGSLLFANGRWSEHPGIPVTVKDTVGAGDSFTAAMTAGWLYGLDLDRINGLANEVASYVCSCAGATPPLPARFSAALGNPRSLPNQH